MAQVAFKNTFLKGLLGHIILGDSDDTYKQALQYIKYNL